MIRPAAMSRRSDTTLHSEVEAHWPANGAYASFDAAIRFMLGAGPSRRTAQADL